MHHMHWCPHALCLGLGHYGYHLHPQVADRRMVKKVAPDKEDVTDRKRLGERKLQFQTRADGTSSAF